MLASHESANFVESEKNKKLAVSNARRRAVSRYNEHFKDINRNKALDQEENVDNKDNVGKMAEEALPETLINCSAYS